MTTPLGQLLTVGGRIDLSTYDSRALVGFEGGKDDAGAALAALGAELASLQEQLFAMGRTQEDAPRVLLVLQGMDTSGKGGVISSVAGLMNPQGLSITSFKKPTSAELEHDFLWRIEKALPAPGMVGVFDRSHYEDVLIAKVRRLVDADELERRYDAINAFEQAFAEAGGVVVKCFLHISKDDQKERLEARLADPTKHWKFNPGDIDERMLWDDYQEAYERAVERCSTDQSPWHLVPSGRKWYRNWAVAALLLEQLRSLGLTWPDADFDIEAEKARLAAT